MSIRSTVEINHDHGPGDTDAHLLAWVKRIQGFLRSGQERDLPHGFDLKWLRHHSAPEPTRDSLLLRAMADAIAPLLTPARGLSAGLIGRATQERADALARVALDAIRKLEP